MRGKSNEERAAIRRDTEAKRNPHKDRAVHIESRGGKTPSLSELPGLRPTEQERADYVKLLREESDRGAALMAAADVENTLEDAIRTQILASADDDWFVGGGAPFRTFSAKIALGAALGIYGDGLRKRLILMKNIRNAFAHASAPIDFSHPRLHEECMKLVPDMEGQRYEAATRRALFLSACYAATHCFNLFIKEADGNGTRQPRFP